jgi:hypothetical protein
MPRILRECCTKPEEGTMDLDDFIITVFCLIDETLPQLTDRQRIRQHGPRRTLWERAVLTLEVVGAYLGLDQDSALFTYFRRAGAPRRGLYARRQLCLARLSVRPGLPLSAFPRGSHVWQRQRDAPDLRWFPRPCPTVLARRHHPPLPGACSRR